MSWPEIGADPGREVGGTTNRPPGYTETPVTPRQLEVGRLCAEGLTNAEIAGRLDIAPRTVKTAVDALRRKLDVAHKRQIGEALRRKGML